eukprot:SAG31_NODE_4617_length_3092_cov_3.405947_2_plen_234_part_00
MRHHCGSRIVTVCNVNFFSQAKWLLHINAATQLYMRPSEAEPQHTCGQKHGNDLGQEYEACAFVIFFTIASSLIVANIPALYGAQLLCSKLGSNGLLNYTGYMGRRKQQLWIPMLTIYTHSARQSNRTIYASAKGVRPYCSVNTRSPTCNPSELFKAAVAVSTESKSTSPKPLDRSRPSEIRVWTSPPVDVGKSACSSSEVVSHLQAVTMRDTDKKLRQLLRSHCITSTDGRK